MDTGLMQEIYRLCRRMDEMRIVPREVPFNNTEMQLMREVVLVNEQGGRIISSKLAKVLGITRSAVSQMVNKLEAKDIVRRVPDERDKKIAYIELSECARTKYEEVKARISAFFGRVIGKLGEARVKRFVGEANEFIDAFDDAAAEVMQEDNNAGETVPRER